MGKHILIVLTNAEQDRDDEFNRWYDDRHLGDVLHRIDGFVAAQRFRLSDTQSAQPAPYRYLAIYEVDDDRVDEAHASLLESQRERVDADAAGREPRVPVTDAMQERREAWFYTAISDRVTADDVVVAP